MIFCTKVDVFFLINYLKLWYFSKLFINFTFLKDAMYKDAKLSKDGELLTGHNSWELDYMDKLYFMVNELGD